MSPIMLRLLACAVSCLVTVLAPRAQAGESGEGQAAARYRQALYARIAVRIVPEKDGPPRTVQSALEQICQAAGVPFQADRSRKGAEDQLDATLPPLTFTNAVAGYLLERIAGRAGLELKIDDDGVYLVPMEIRAPRQLDPAERMRMGAAIDLRVKPLHDKDTNKTTQAYERPVTDYSRGGHTTTRMEREYVTRRETTERTQLEIAFVSSLPCRGIVIQAYLFASIQPDSLASDTYTKSQRPRYGPHKDIIRVHSETLAVGDVPHSQRRTLKTYVVKTAYAEQELTKEQREDRRNRGKKAILTGERYYGYVVDFYAGGQLVKTVASSRALIELLGRDNRTGFPR